MRTWLYYRHCSVYGEEGEKGGGGVCAGGGGVTEMHGLLKAWPMSIAQYNASMIYIYIYLVEMYRQ